MQLMRFYRAPVRAAGANKTKPKTKKGRNNAAIYYEF